MKRLIITVALAMALPLSILADCAATAKIVDPVFSESARSDFETKLKTAHADFEKSPNGADEAIWYGRRLAYLGKYRESISIFTEGNKKHPTDARFLRHRGHRMITLRCFDDAVKDFEAGSVLIKGKPDQVEPDGLPNAQNTPTSTLQSNIWYHLGLAYYLQGDFENALRAYKECLKVSKNPDMLVATVNWLFVTQKRLGLDKKAVKTIEPITSDLKLIENDGYFQMIRMYKGELKPADLAGSGTEALTNATMLYGIGNWELINGRTKEATSYFESVVKSDQWASFGYISAETELARMKGGN